MYSFPAPRLSLPWDVCLGAGLYLASLGPELLYLSLYLAEHRAMISPWSSEFRRSLRVRPDELRQLDVPTLVIWGDHDPIGGVEAAQATARLIPKARLEVLPAGHVPGPGHPERVSELLSTFVRSGSDG